MPHHLRSHRPRRFSIRNPEDILNMPSRVYRVALLDEHFRPKHYERLSSVPGIELQPVLPSADLGLLNCDIALLGDEFNPAAFPAITELHARGIPVLHLVDGIVEWRNIWTNPRSNTPDGRPLFQPVLSARIACLGLWQALLLESFGNHPFRCEVTGSPRLDYLESIEREPNNTVLIATANTPGFTAKEIEQAAAAMQAAEAGMRKFPRLTPHWRLSPSLLPHVSFDGNPGASTQVPLERILATAAAVITTPSTLALEAMRLRIPTLIVDFTNSPAYLLSAWRATCPDTLGRELESLLKPDDPEHLRRLLHQDFLSRLQLEPGSATERVGRLIKLMADNPAASLNPTGLLLPRRSAYPEGTTEFNLTSLYPMIPDLATSDTTVLQARLLHQRDCLRELEGYRRRRLVRFSDWVRRIIPFRRGKSSGIDRAVQPMNASDHTPANPDRSS